jgi:hypothetical protein
MYDRVYDVPKGMPRYFLSKKWIYSWQRTENMMLTYLQVCLEGSCKSGRSSNLAPVTMHRLTDWGAVQSHHLNVVGVEDPST